MKTTIDLPDDLVRRLKIRAVRDGRKMKDLAADYLKKGLESTERKKGREAPAVVVRDRKTGLPVILCRRTPKKNELTPDDIANILIEQEAEWVREAS